MPQLHVHPTLEALASAFAAEFIGLANASIGTHGQFAVALTGGRSAGALYQELARPEHRNAVDWTKVKIFWGDERAVPGDHPDSNYKLALEAWLKAGPVPPPNIHPWQGAPIDGVAEAERYAALLEREVPPNPGLAHSARPGLDLVLLGMGDDGHVASLFPGSPALEYKTELTAFNTVPQLGAKRFTLTFVALNAARNVWFIVSGGGKAGRVAEVFGCQANGETKLHIPATRIQPPAGSVVWWLDEPAAAKLQQASA